MYRVGIFTCPNTGILRIIVSRQVKPRLVREPSIVQNARIFLNTLRTGDADLRFYITTMQDG